MRKREAEEAKRHQAGFGTMMRQVREDSKLSSNDWSAQYAARKAEALRKIKDNAPKKMKL